ncbi:hypothetical protein CY34DRAFT_74626 [Suillus luteus UH-Slu-Lm8-n1]|uniref:Uncharacterized protein n=1 Tax=Suillus luteus UH-Slu-Lm8-n1 TaxID=930992 RepID=A0A0D0BMQ2_9AGAM|nr:hypothetical protein CY34DRAFT_74626 [Suillus luteus UH-Slu-Lm8-n1]
MNSINVSMGTSPFQLHLGRSPCVIPPIKQSKLDNEPEDKRTHTLMAQLQNNVMEAQDSLLAAKAS